MWPYRMDLCQLVCSLADSQWHTLSMFTHQLKLLWMNQFIILYNYNNAIFFYILNIFLHSTSFASSLFSYSQIWVNKSEYTVRCISNISYCLQSTHTHCPSRWKICLMDNRHLCRFMKWGASCLVLNLLHTSYFLKNQEIKLKNSFLLILNVCQLKQIWVTLCPHRITVNFRVKFHHLYCKTCFWRSLPHIKTWVTAQRRHLCSCRWTSETFFCCMSAFYLYSCSSSSLHTVVLADCPLFIFFLFLLEQHVSYKHYYYVIIRARKDQLFIAISCNILHSEPGGGHVYLMEVTWDCNPTPPVLCFSNTHCYAQCTVLCTKNY